MTRRGRTSIGIVGARGYVGGELIRLAVGHPHLEIAFVSSRALEGEEVASHVEGAPPGLRFTSFDEQGVAESGAEVLILALPNGKAHTFVSAIDAGDRPQRLIVDVSADHRFDDSWAYGLPERFRDRIRGARRIANPGCYATAAQLAIAPMLDVLGGVPAAFGVSGYSGAGTTPSDKNDPDLLHDNLLPYSLTGHLHEREVSRHVGRPVHFLPHVAPFFRGITVTVNLPLGRRITTGEMGRRYESAWGREPLIRLTGEKPPLVRDIAGRHHVSIGGWSAAADGSRAAVVATIDNLLKGAATQAVQNVNLACGYDELAGIDHE